MGASGLVAGIVLVLALIGLSALVIVGLVLLVAGGLARQGRGSTILVRSGSGVLVAVAVVVVGVLVWARWSGDPGTLQLDLRAPVSAASLDKEPMPGFPGAYDYNSDRVEMVLPDGSRFATDVVTATLWADGDLVTSVQLSDRAMPTEEAVEVIERWAEALGARPIGIDTAAGTRWSDAVLAGGLEAEMSLQPLGSGAESRPFLSIELIS